MREIYHRVHRDHIEGIGSGDNNYLFDRMPDVLGRCLIEFRFVSVPNVVSVVCSCEPSRTGAQAIAFACDVHTVAAGLLRRIQRRVGKIDQ